MKTKFVFFLLKTFYVAENNEENYYYIQQNCEQLLKINSWNFHYRKIPHSIEVY